MWCAQVTDCSIDTEFYVGSIAPPYALDAPLVGGDRYYTDGPAGAAESEPDLLPQWNSDGLGGLDLAARSKDRGGGL